MKEFNLDAARIKGNLENNNRNISSETSDIKKFKLIKSTIDELLKIYETPKGFNIKTLKTNPFYSITVTPLFIECTIKKDNETKKFKYSHQTKQLQKNNNPINIDNIKKIFNLLKKIITALEDKKAEIFRLNK